MFWYFVVLVKIVPVPPALQVYNASVTPVSDPGVHLNSGVTMTESTSGVTRVRWCHLGRQLRCHPYFFMKNLTTVFAHNSVAFIDFNRVSPPSRVSSHTFFYLSDLVCPPFFVNSPTIFFRSGVTPCRVSSGAVRPRPLPLVTPLERTCVVESSWTLVLPQTSRFCYVSHKLAKRTNNSSAEIELQGPAKPHYSFVKSIQKHFSRHGSLIHIFTQASHARIK